MGFVESLRLLLFSGAVFGVCFGGYRLVRRGTKNLRDGHPLGCITVPIELALLLGAVMGASVGGFLVLRLLALIIGGLNAAGGGRYD